MFIHITVAPQSAAITSGRNVIYYILAQHRRAPKKSTTQKPINNDVYVRLIIYVDVEMHHSTSTHIHFRISGWHFSETNRLAMLTQWLGVLRSGWIENSVDICFYRSSGNVVCELGNMKQCLMTGVLFDRHAETHFGWLVRVLLMWNLN